MTKREFDAMREAGLGLIRRERDALVIYGDDAVPWMQGLVTNDLRELAEPGSGQRSAFVNTTGRFISDARILHIQDVLLLDLEPGILKETLLTHLRRHIIMEEVRLDDRTQATAHLGVWGPAAAERLAALGTFDAPPASLKSFHGTTGALYGHGAILWRLPWTKAPYFELTCDTSVAQDLMDSLSQEMPIFGDETFEILRVEAGVPAMGRELHEKAIPLEARFDDAISYEKGCYLGQEIIARLDTLGTPAKLLRQLRIPGDEVPPVGAPIFPESGEGRPIGHVESAVKSFDDGVIALAYIKRKHNESGALVSVHADPEADDPRGMIATLQVLPDVTEL